VLHEVYSEKNDLGLNDVDVLLVDFHVIVRLSFLTEIALPDVYLGVGVPKEKLLKPVHKSFNFLLGSPFHLLELLDQDGIKLVSGTTLYYGD
jgi:hypothetical protein